MNKTMYTIGTDIGGTFTDVVAVDQVTGALRLGKRLTRPGEEQEGLADAIVATGVDPGEIEIAFHGTTLVINALLERRGARTALVTTAGFEDILGMGRANRPQIFNPFFSRERPLVPRELCFGLVERISSRGEIVTAMDEKAVVELVRRFEALNLEAIAICLLNSYKNPSHELLVQRIIRREAPNLAVTVSSELSGEWREFERACTTVANAYVMPKVQTYLGSIETRLAKERFKGTLYLLHSSGGAMPLKAARQQPIQLVESGPTGGVIGAQRLAKRLGIGDVVVFDMGGTTAKSAAIESGHFQTRDDYWIGGYERGFPVQIPTIDIIEVGAGGGSIAWLDQGTRLRVGPVSAGASPGPACYGFGGTQPTVTDANVFCGRLASDFFIGELELDASASRSAIESLAHDAGIAPVRLALGILELANLEMAGSVRRQTLERGRDPGNYTLIATGGAGPGHACDVAAEVGIRRVLIPPYAGVFSALGMALSQLKAEHRITFQSTLENLDFEKLNSQLEEVETGLRRRLQVSIEDRPPLGSYSSRLWAYMRYAGQEHRLRILATEGVARLTSGGLKTLIESFEIEYKLNFGRVYSTARVNFAGFEVEISRSVNVLDDFDGEGGYSDFRQIGGTREVIFPERQGGKQATSIMPRTNITVDSGPAIIYEPGAVTVVPPGWAISKLQDGSILLNSNEIELKTVMQR